MSVANVPLSTTRLSTTIPTWECYHCGLFNYDNQSYCKACQEECMYTGGSENNSKQQYTTLDIITLFAKNSIEIGSKCTIIVNELPEEMANEDLGNRQLFGMFGDVKKIEIIRNQTLITTTTKEENPHAEITFYSSDSVVELMKLSSAYYNYKIFC